MSELRPFHLAIPVSDLQRSRSFYGQVMGLEEGRSSDKWVDFNFYGHQLVIHESGTKKTNVDASNPVDGHDVPIPHFGIVLDMQDWENLAKRLKEHEINFMIEPYIRFKGEVGEQATMFFKDTEGNALEFKSFKNLENLFAK